MAARRDRDTWLLEEKERKRKRALEKAQKARIKKYFKSPKI